MAAEMMQQYSSEITHMSLVIDGLEEEIKRLRMLPLSTITAAFGRMVRDLADRANKEAILTIVGGETELDKRILEQIKDPLVHLLRNAVDHGIETPEVRLAQGKPRFGQVTLSAEQAGKDVVIRISDDGKGLDLDAIRQAVARHGRKDPSVMSETELIDSIFALGMTTSRIITDVSGRGVGMDVVRRNVETLHGRIDVENRPGSGVTFVLTLPLALTGSRGLLVRVAGQLFIAPINTIERTIFIDRSEIFSLEGHDTIQFNGRPVTLVSLGDVLGLPASTLSEGRITAIILSAAGRRMAFIVDELTGEQEVVIKGLGKQLLRVGGVAGATVMGNGEVVLILNATDLMKLALHGQKRSLLEKLAKEAAPTQLRTSKRILIVDDSITTRTLEKNILEAAGYTVQLAIDGQEALSIVRSGERPDLIVTDIVMPRMDGFELTRQIKSDAQTETLPVILVTSLDSAEDKEHGIEVRADAYIVKSSFDQINLLETIEQLI
jgi:two-component system chemotaxis sensor kinase CheA